VCTRTLRIYADIPYSYLHMRKAILCCVLLLAPALLAGPEIAVSSAARQRAPFAQRGPRIATDGTNFLVAFYDERMPDVPLYVTRLGSDGKPLDPGPIRLPNAHVDVSGYYLVTWTGRVYLVAWMDYGQRTLKWVRVDRDGRVLDDQPRAITGVTTPHDPASIDGRTLIVFTGDWPETRLSGQFIDADGTAEGKRITFPHAGRSDWTPRIATNGDAFYVVWTRFFGQRVDVVGIPVSREGQFGAERTIGTGDSVHLASNGGHYLVSYMPRTNTMTTMITEELDGNGAVLTKTEHASARIYGAAALTASGSGYLLATFETNGVVARVLDASGRETGRLPLDASNTSTNIIALASHGTSTIAVWNEESDLLPSGSDVFAEVVDTQRDRTLMSEGAAHQTGLRVATDGNRFLATWIETRERTELRAGRISANGAPLDGEGIVIGEFVAEPPAVVFDGANYVVVWIEKRPSGACAVRAARITHEGLNLDGSGKLLSSSCTASLALGHNGRDTLLVRSSSEIDPATSRITEKLLAHRLQRDLTMSDAVVLPTRNRRAIDLAVGAIDGMWLVAWTRLNEDCGMCNPPMPPTFDVDAVRLSDAWTVLDGDPLDLAATSSDRAPSIGAMHDEFLVAWERMSDDTVRARRVPRFGTPLAEQLVTAGRAPSVVAHNGAFVVAYEAEGNLFTTTIGTPGSAPIATSDDREHSVHLVDTNAGLTAAYLRVASEPLYNFVDRGFLRILDSTPRRRAIRK
jgi:hypothetical protein